MTTEMMPCDNQGLLSQVDVAFIQEFFWNGSNEQPSVVSTDHTQTAPFFQGTVDRTVDMSEGIEELKRSHSYQHLRLHTDTTTAAPDGFATAFSPSQMGMDSHQQQLQLAELIAVQQMQIQMMPQQPSFASPALQPQPEPTLKQVTYPVLTSSKRPALKLHTDMVRMTPSQIMNISAAFPTTPTNGSQFSFERPLSRSSSTHQLSQLQPVSSLPLSAPYLQQQPQLPPQQSSQQQQQQQFTNFSHQYDVLQSPLFTKPRDQSLNSPFESPIQFFSTPVQSTPNTAFTLAPASSRLNPAYFEPLDADFELLEGLGVRNNDQQDGEVDEDGNELKGERRKAYRKNAEKKRRDQMKTCLNEVKQLLPKANIRSKIVSKERVVEKAFEYIVELQEHSEQKAEVIRTLEAEINALRAVGAV
ncbi:hypothetical protein BJ741DRAFT_603804 [Chytriomyces cf. hyalinus JEL632]|nr:hypothetical protein BJ741DRAFT_603804 [Chytriomyces cf. hyalinus JEL632]